METTFAHLIDGELVAGRRHFDVVNPATGAPFAQCPDATRGTSTAPCPPRRARSPPAGRATRPRAAGRSRT
jgi:acyl-CoA reductase-like NAD-dependent aldehyde dehydrogenase